MALPPSSMPLVASSSTPYATSSERIAIIDALRGLAAVSVMLFHFQSHPGLAVVWGRLGSALRHVLQAGELGVQIFFVISGFVIAYSLRERRMSWRVLGNFAWRRALRLDPPYWTSIGLAIGLAWLSRTLFATADVELPSLSAVAAHLFYLQELLGFPHIYPIYWTLCHEVQFYLLHASLLAVGQAWSARSTSRPWLQGVGPVPVLLLWAITGLVSGSGGIKFPGLCLDTWYLFALGVLTYGMVHENVPRRLWLGYLCVLCVWHLDLEQVEWPHKVAALATAGALAWGAARNSAWTWTRQSFVQFLGRISYSLYLTHGMVGYRVLSLVDRWAGRSLASGLLGLAAAITVSLGVGWAMYVAVEAPCQRWAKRWKSADGI